LGPLARRRLGWLPRTFGSRSRQYLREAEAAAGGLPVAPATPESPPPDVDVAPCPAEVERQSRIQEPAPPPGGGGKYKWQVVEKVTVEKQGCWGQR